MNLQALIDNLLFEEEGNTLDFKSKQYRFSGASDEDKSELLKDILAFSNVWRRTDAYILIGIMEVKGGRSQVIGISEHLDDANLQQFVNSKTQRPIDFSYKATQYEGGQIGIIHVPVQRRPFYVQKDFGKVKKSQVYVRRGSSTDVATLDEISLMGSTTAQDIRQVPSLDAFLVFGKQDEIMERSIVCRLTNATIPIDEEFPDYGIGYGSAGFNITHYTSLPMNRDYYREQAKFFKAHRCVKAFKLAIKNGGSVPARDVKVIFDVPNEEGESIACELDDLPHKPHRDKFHFPLIHNGLRKTPDVSVKKTSTGWRITCHLGKIQPKDTVTTHDIFCLGALTSKVVTIDAQIYSDDLPEPKHESLTVTFAVENRVYTVDDFLLKKKG